MDRPSCEQHQSGWDDLTVYILSQRTITQPGPASRPHWPALSSESQCPRPMASTPPPPPPPLQSVVSSPVPLHQLHDLHLGQFPRAPGAGTRAGAGVSKLYRPTYPWGQLSGWYKQTVADPTASLSAERRGSISLPDVESCFSKGGTGRTPYSAKERRDLLEALARRPDAQWRSGTIFSFRNEARVYGSPMLDDAWDRVEGRAGGLEAVLQELRDADVPPTFGGSAGSKAGARSRCVRTGPPES